jgi:hypothetical protein
MSEEIRFNINNYVKVKLTDYGKSIIANNKYVLTHYKEDDDGWSKWQLWELMSVFGDYVSLGREVPFDTEIIIILKP